MTERVRTGSARSGVGQVTKPETVRLNVDITKDLDDVLSGVAVENGASKAEMLRRAILLLEASHKARQRGQSVGVAAPDSKLETEFLGI